MMNDNIKCSNCGTDNSVNNNYCINCGNALTKENQVINVEESVNNQDNLSNNSINIVKEDDKKGNIIAIISALLFYFNSSVFAVLSSITFGAFKPILSILSAFSPIIAIGLMVYGRVNYPQNKFLKVLMWVMIITVVLGILAFIAIAIIIGIICNNVDTSGCN